jgi:hypothetical protein
MVEYLADIKVMITFTVNYVRLCQLDGSWVQNESSCDLCHS